jgi:hypothetical protein
MNKIIGFKRSSPTNINMEPQCDPNCCDYSGKDFSSYDQRYKIMEVDSPIQTMVSKYLT